MKKLLRKSIVIVGLTFLLPGIVSFLIKDSYSKYASLNRPPLSPPAFIFPVVWSIIYLLISIAVIRVKNDKRFNLKLYYISLIINTLWSPLFFLFNWYFIALIDLILLFYSVVKMYKNYKTTDDLSALLLIPYMLWLIFAFYLNLYVSIFN